jgi:succinate-acetate transporter protein
MATPIDQLQKKAPPGSSTNHVETQHASAYDVENQAESRPKIPPRVGNPSPLGLFSFGTGIDLPSFYVNVTASIFTKLTTSVAGIFLIATLNLHARGVAIPNLIVGVLVFFGGLGQVLSGIMEFIRGNTVSQITFSGSIFSA